MVNIVRSPVRRRLRRGSAGSPGARVVAVALVLALAGSACGITPEDDANELRVDQVPFNLLDLQDVGSELPADVGGVGEVYLMAGEVLLSVPRPIAPDAELSTVLEVLIAGPTRNEAAIGLRSALPRDPTILSVEQSGRTAVVDLDPAFTEIRAADQPIAIAQIVFTLTRRPDVERVTFTLEEDSVEVPRGDGSLTSEPLTRSDFPEMTMSSGDSEEATTTTTTTTTTVPASTTTTTPAPTTTTEPPAAGAGD